MDVEKFGADFFYQANRANLMLLSGYPPKTIDVIFFHDRSYGDFTNLFQMAASMYKSGIARFIATPNTDGARFGRNIPREASPGKEWVTRQLLALHLPIESIIRPDMPSHHTWEENNAFLQLARERKWRSAAILTQPHQLLRTMLGMVKAMDNTGYLMEVYTATPIYTPWYEITRVNQGEEEKMRVENIDDELIRIPQYQEKGDLASLEELSAYLEARERGSIRFTKDLPPDLQELLS